MTRPVSMPRSALSAALFATGTLAAARAAQAISSRQRVTTLPDVPTLEKAGVSGAESGSWLGLLAPAGTPPAIIEKISRDVQQVLAMPEVQHQLLAQAALAKGRSGADHKRHARIITDNNLQAD